MVFCFCIGKLPNGIPYRCVIRRMCLYFHRKEICAYTCDAPNKEHFFQCRYIEKAHISDVHLISTVLCLDKLMDILHVFYYSGTEQVDAAVL